MNLNLLTNKNIAFKGYYDQFFDKPEEDRFDSFKYIPEDEKQISSETVPIEYFLRDYELFDKQKDFVDRTYIQYGIDDVEIPIRHLLNKVPKDIYDKSDYVESPYFETEHKLPKSIQIYTADNSLKKEHESFQTRLNQGFSRKEVSTVYHSALIDKSEDLKTMDYTLAKKGFNLLSTGEPLDVVKKVMDGSKIHHANGSSTFNNNLFDFLTLYPDSRKYVVERKNNHEVFHSDVASVFPLISQYCADKRDVGLIVDVCRTGEKDKYKVDDELVKLSVNTIKEGKSVPYTANLIKKSKLVSGNGTKEFNKDLFNFLSEFPNDRDSVVTVSKVGNEYFISNVADKYNKLKSISSDKKEISQIINACLVGTKQDKIIDSRALDICYNSVKNGNSISDVLEGIRDAKLKDINDGEFFDEELYDFIQKYPDSRNFVVRDNMYSTIFRRDRAEVYPILAEKCKIEDIEDIMSACEVYSKSQGTRIDGKLFDLAIDLLNINPDWTRNHDKIMGGVVKNSMYGARTVNIHKYDLAKTMSSSGYYGIDSIYSVVVLNNKNVELCK